jgi:hypothetical protein
MIPALHNVVKALKNQAFVAHFRRVRQGFLGSTD